MDIELKIKQTLKKVGLSKRDKILVALSGGKDSAVTCYLLKKFGYRIEGFHIDLQMGEYSDKCFKAVQDLCKQLEIRLHTYDIKQEMGSGMCYLRSAIQTKRSLKNCAICGVIKKWIMNKEARRLGARKIATGHNLDDEAQTFLINVLKGSPGLSANSGAISKNTRDKKFVPRIKPLFYIPEDEVRKYSEKQKLPVIYEKCPCALDSYRIQVRKFMNTMPDKEKLNIIKNMGRIMDWRKNSETSPRDTQRGHKNLRAGDSGEPKINYCKTCGEPARNEVCKACELLDIR